MEKINTANKQVLVEIVKMAQKRAMKGSKGSWKEFLNYHDRKFGACLSDPLRRSVDDLVAFLKTFTVEDDLKYFAKVMQWHSNREAVEQFKKQSPVDESSEQRLVRLTIEHPNYPVYYLFPSHEEEWMVTNLNKKSKARRSTEMVAIDCEMVLCEDGSEALVRVCVVDRNLQVKLHEFVKPNKGVADYRTKITGVTAKDLDGVTCSLVDIQKSMKKILSHGTILVGHSLNNDLQALRIDHAKVIDTSLIFKYWDQPLSRRPSLYDLCKSVLGYEVRKKDAPHNCLDDARAAMRLALAKIERGFDNDIPLVHEDEAETEMAKLLLHRIPVTVPIEELHDIIPGNYTIELQSNKKAKGEKYSAFAIFKNPEEAHQSFENVVSDQNKDSSGRPQKYILFQLSTGVTARLCVRRMTCGPLRDVPSKKRLSQVEEPTGESKKLKTGQCIEDSTEMNADSNLCNDHEEEIERLKQQLKQRDHEINSLHKIIAALTRKQGL
ncbi:small RNA degrading nuclease 1 isoform X2 [Malania oleifera]|uniref:small RNA degrading nuclease 1 isoform X2 n=1 Tax=Malania oleifera TaxID=397392 RepID=UPI0025AE7432|nr:small RNA degrading nuclease 1 isoform X2 [Malania oleifera]